MNMKLNFTNSSSHPDCRVCKERPMNYLDTGRCHLCESDSHILKFVKPYNLPVGQDLDDHLFPDDKIYKKNVAQLFNTSTVLTP